MAKLMEMVEIAGSVEEAEVMARGLIKNQGPAYLLDLQLLLAIQGRFDEALVVNEKALKNNPDDLRARFDLGWHMMRKGKLFEGFELVNAGREIGICGNSHIGTSKPIWDGKDAQDKHILFVCEAGFGDQMLFIRFAKDVVSRGAKVTVACSVELMNLFSNAPGIPSIVDNRQALSVYHDYWIPSFGFPIIVRYQYEDISGKAYLKAPIDKVRDFSKLMKTNKLKVGIRWKGSPEFEHEQFRLFPPELMFNAIRGDDIEVYSLQDDEEAPSDFRDLAPFLKTWEDTAGAIENLDLVISSCTAVGHLSAAMGKPTWIITPILPYWAWATEGDKSPWYDSVTLFRQTKFEVWSDVFDRIKKALKDYG